MDKDRWKVVGKYAYNTRDVLGIGVWGTVYRAHLHCE